MSEDDLLLRASKFDVRRREMVGSDGRVHIYQVVTHPGAAVILPILADERVVLIANHRVAVNAELLEIPAGTLEPGESPLKCARRELIEETGYAAGRLEPLVSFYSTPGILTERMHVFLATELTPGAARPEGGERIRPVLMEYADAVRAIADGRIVDGKTIAALLYYDRFVRGDCGKDRG